MAVVRATDSYKMKIALYDLLRYANLHFVDTAKKLEPEYADSILTNIMKRPLKSSCCAAAIAPLEEDADIAIKRLREIHPPAHVIIVSTRHEVYRELSGYIELLPDVNMSMNEKVKL